MYIWEVLHNCPKLQKKLCMIIGIPIVAINKAMFKTNMINLQTNSYPFICDNSPLRKKEDMLVEIFRLEFL